MLNFNEISLRIDNPSKIELEDLEELRQLVKKYPFTAIFSQLYLKGLALHNTIQFESELKNHAYKVPDRAQLFYLVNYVEESLNQEDLEIDNPTEESIENIEKKSSHQKESLNDEIFIDVLPELDKPIEEPKDEILEIISSLPEQDDTLIIVEEGSSTILTAIQESFKSDTETLKEEGLKDVQIENNESKKDTNAFDNKSEPNKLKNISNQLRNISDLDRDILAHAVSSSIFIEIDEIEAETYHFEKLKKLDRSEIREEKHESTSIEFDLPITKKGENLGSLEKQVGDSQIKFKGKARQTLSLDEGKKSFTSWMSSFVSDEVPEKTKAKKVVLSQKVSETVKKVEVKEKNKEIFTPEKRKSEFFSPVKKARESLDESRLPVSETLAKVYGAQGNYPKAIEAYEKLLLKFPEKKSFFALQIETLKRKLN